MCQFKASAAAYERWPHVHAGASRWAGQPQPLRCGTENEVCAALRVRRAEHDHVKHPKRFTLTITCPRQLALHGFALSLKRPCDRAASDTTPTLCTWQRYSRLERSSGPVDHVEGCWYRGPATCTGQHTESVRGGRECRLRYQCANAKV